MKKILLLVSMVIFSQNILASDGSSGCGPGWYLFQKNSLVSSALRATTNGILFPSTTIGMTMGTSNCSSHAIVKNEKESLKFATENYYEIASDAAKGKGDFLISFASTIGCRVDNIKVFNQEMQKNFSKIYDGSKVDPERMLKETYILIFENQALAQSCTLS